MLTLNTNQSINQSTEYGNTLRTIVHIALVQKNGKINYLIQCSFGPYGNLNCFGPYTIGRNWIERI